MKVQGKTDVYRRTRGNTAIKYALASVWPLPGSQTKKSPTTREAALASLTAPLRPVPVLVDPTDASEEHEVSGR